MALSDEVLKNIAYAQERGFDKLNLYPPAQTREMMKLAPKNPNPTLVAEVINIEVSSDCIPVRIYKPFGEAPFPVICYFHGGGFVIMSLDTHDELCRQICIKTGCLVMSVDYRLAPEYPYPSGPESSFAAVRWMKNNAGEFGGIADKIAVAGDSAGGYMALYVAQRMKAEGINLSAQFAAYPVTDHYSAKHKSWDENKSGYILTAEMMKWFWDNFTSDSSQYDQASLLRIDDFRGLPPAIIMTANYDPLRDEGKSYAQRLKDAGVETVYKNYENTHGFFGAGEMGQQALEEACNFLKEKLRS